METAWKQNCTIFVNERPLGSVEVFYLEPRPEEDEGPFLDEERSLLDTIAVRLGKHIQRLRAEEALKASEAEFRGIINQSYDGIVLADGSGIVIEWNHGAEQITGLMRAEALGRYLWDAQFQVAPEEFKTPDNYRRLKAMLERFFHTQQVPWDDPVRETTLQRPDGRRVVVQSSIFPIQTEAGFLTCSFMRDITESKRVEKALRESEDRFHKMADNLQDGLSIIERGKVVYVNDRLCEITGCSREELFETSGIELAAPDEKDRLTRIMHESQQTGVLPSELEYWIIRKDGGRRYIHNRYALINWGDSQNDRYTITTDLTERKLAEEELRKLSVAVEQSPSTVVITDIKGNIEYANPAFTHITGYSASEAIGVNPRELIKSGKHPPEFYQNLWDTILGGQEWHGEFINRKKNGELYWELTSISPIKNGQGEITRFIKVAEDITDRVRTEAEVLRARDELASLLAISQEMVSTLDLQPLLDLILEQLAGVFSYTSALILTIEQGQITFQAYRGLRQAAEVQAWHIPISQVPQIRQVIENRQMFYIPDVHKNNDLLLSVSQAVGLPFETVARYRTWFGLPLVVKGQLIGLLLLLHIKPDFYNPSERSLAQAFAYQAAIAIENARMYQEAGEVAKLAERSRLAGDLHDSVTQSLFSASLIAEVLPQVWRHNPDDALQALDELRKLTRGALAEMRTLLLELRPAYLTEKPLGELLRTLTHTTSNRSGIPISLSIGCDSALAPEVQIAFYRIAQEALNNILKHAEASRAEVDLNCQPTGAEIRIQDNGRGFDPNIVKPEQRGMGNIRERAMSIGADLEIRSQPEQGTQIRVSWHAG